MNDTNGVLVKTLEMNVEPMLQASQPNEYMALAPQNEMALSLQAVPGQQFIGPTQNDSSVFSLNNIGWGGFSWAGTFEIVLLDVTIVLPIVNEVHLIPHFDGGDDLDSPVLAEVGKNFRLRGTGLLVAYQIEVQIRIQIAVIIGVYVYFQYSGFFGNEFPEFDWGFGVVVLGFRIEVQVMFNLSFLLALVKPDGQMVVLAAYNLTAGVDFKIDQDGFHFGKILPQRKSYKPYIIGISPATDQPTLCGNKFQLLPQNGQAAVSDGTGFVANYAVNEAGNCCLPWDFNTQLLRFSANEQPTVIQAGFRTTYCLMAVQPPEVKVELALAYKDSAGQIQKADGIYRDEPTDLNTPNIDVNDVTKVRNYFLAAKIDFPTPPTFPVAVKVKVDSAALNLIPFPADTFGSKFDRSSGTNIKQFFKGTLIQNGFEATLTLNSLPAKDQLILFDNANIVPNRVEY